MKEVKVCNKCGKVKPLEEFYKNLHMADGRLNHCCDCHNRYSKKWRIENKDWINDYIISGKAAENTARSRQKRKNESPEQFSKSLKDSHRKDFVNHPEKHKTRDKLRLAVRRGKIIKPDKCSKCGIEGVKINAHHEDYSRPYDVLWLCDKCHVERHMEIKKQKALGE